MSFLSLGKLIDIKLMDSFIQSTESLEIIVHKYGNNFNDIPTHPCWMEYRNEANVSGCIGFTRNTDKHPILSEMVTIVLDKFSTIFPKDFPLLRERVHLMKTQGNIVPHRDEGGRSCCINIGIKNSTGALTEIGIEDNYETFKEKKYTYIVEPGVGYLLDTSRLHSVTAINDFPRYLITYGFSQSFTHISSLLKISK